MYRNEINDVGKAKKKFDCKMKIPFSALLKFLEKCGFN